GFEPVQPPVVVEFKQAPDNEECPFCEGMGLFLSGSHNPDHQLISCSRCNGKGYVLRPMENAAPPVAAPPVTLDPSFMPGGNGQQYPDQWGRPSTHPHYGIHPAQVGA